MSKDAGFLRGGWHSQHPHPVGTLVANPKSDPRANRPLPWKNMGEGRARFRNSLERAELMQPGEIYQFTIQLYPTSNVFKAGHHIRLDISSSNFPRFDPNPNTGEALNGHTHTLVARNTLYHDASHPSHVILPVIPKS